MTKPILSLAMFALAAPVLAQAQPAAPPAAPADGISFDQWAARARERMMALDTDHDGKISKAEFEARAAAMGRGPGGGGASFFDRLDTNKDGFIDAGEIDSMLHRRFDRMDVNHDGVLTPDERQAMRGPGAPEQ